MIRSWRERLTRLGLGFVAGVFFTAGFQEHYFWFWTAVVVLAGLFTADEP